MEERPVGELPQHGRPLGVHDLSGGTVSDVGSGQIKRSGPLAVTKGLELDRNSFLVLLLTSPTDGDLRLEGTRCPPQPSDSSYVAWNSHRYQACSEDLGAWEQGITRGILATD